MATITQWKVGASGKLSDTFVFWDHTTIIVCLSVCLYVCSYISVTAFVCFSYTAFFPLVRRPNSPRGPVMAAATQRQAVIAGQSAQITCQSPVGLLRQPSLIRPV